MSVTTIKISYHFDGTDVIIWYFFKTNTAQNMREYGFSLTRIQNRRFYSYTRITVNENPYSNIFYAV